MSLQLSSEQSVGDVLITQLDWKRVSSGDYNGPNPKPMYTPALAVFSLFGPTNRFRRNAERVGGGMR